MKNLNRNIKQSIYWNYISSIVIHGISLITSAVLLKFLTPEDFGILATLFLILGLGSIFIGQGYISAIIREKIIDDTILSTVFWINVGFGILVVVLSFALGDSLGEYFEIERMQEYLTFFSLAYLLQAINVVPLAILERKLDFKQHSIIHIYATIISALLAITLAVYQYNVYSLLWRGLSAGLVVTILVWYKSGWRPKFAFKYNSLNDMHKFSRGVLGTQLLRYGANQLDNLMVLKMLGTTDLGIYNRAKTFVQKPAREIHAKTRSVAYSALSKIEDAEEYRNLLFKFILLLAMVIIPLLLIVMITSDTLIYSYLYEEWYPMIKILKLLAIASIIISTTLPTQILLSLGKSDTLFKLEIVSNILKIGILLIAFQYASLLTIVCLFLLGQLISNLLQNIFAYRSVEGYQKLIWKYHLLPVVMAFIVYSIAVLIDHFISLTLVSMLFKIIVCLGIYGYYAWRTYPDLLKSLIYRDAESVE